ncbi:DUF58 domain-containing protein [Xanthomonas campestris pv. badrii]|uniref:DUF58 domain-containing protein n=1 Tax=Xanthomonas campestris pv. badrii TaxID=149696 RepID=A0A7Z2V8E2_XANCA|nr:DUF58 domain-containing protein [Xanthomonas campestris]MCC4603062.1 DUF58 domain-containing protein [Xanthomonas campestris pv. parthenii]QJD66653.1 DUF58 domain-containing protein [Xanthomonas campestris pv. badrii]
MAQAAVTAQDLFDASFLDAVQALSLRIARAQRGGRLAEQRSSARGQGAEFADFKPYASGDDLRAIDWNVYQRLGRVFVRVFEEQQDLPVYLLVDDSASMVAEQPPRLRAALRSAFALAAIALSQQDSVSILPFADAAQLPPRRLSGRANLMRMASQLGALTGQGGTALVQALRQLAGSRLRRGLVVVVSDFFDPAGIDAVVAALQALPHRVLLVQLVRAHDADPQLHPELQGDVLIDDGEPGHAVPLSVSPELLRAYAQVHARFNAGLAGFVAAGGGGLLRIDAAEDVLPQLLAAFGNGELRL